MRRLTASLLACVTGMSLAIASCSGDNGADDTAANGDATVSPPETVAATAAAENHAAQFLTDAMKGDNSEVRVGRLAVENGSSKGVRDFGQMLVMDHGKAKEQVVQVALAMNVPATDDTLPEADAVYTRLQALSGADFDKEFVAAMIEDHRKDIDKFEQEAGSGDPAQVTDLARQTVPTLRKHLETAQSLQ